MARLKKNPPEHDFSPELENKINDHARLADQIRSEFDLEPRYSPTHIPKSISDNPHGLPNHAIQKIQEHKQDAYAYMDRAGEIKEAIKNPINRRKKTNRVIGAMRKAFGRIRAIRGEFGITEKSSAQNPPSQKSEQQS